MEMKWKKLKINRVTDAISEITVDESDPKLKRFGKKLKGDEWGMIGNRRR